ncbi:membrane protein [Flexivirga endophytica]|uniref:Membrane protein n=2 Tax=Flexivirga endophytica TaxID=1849103 RepID=A0A916TAK5_9MICO|nr:membrane protein [Flexivirga endophytica]GHB46029.1 membrane protein [Flexivirga endophytica]
MSDTSGRRASAPDEEPDAGRETLSRRDLQDRAIRGASWTMIHTVTGVPVAFFVNLLLAHALGVVHYGRLAFLMTLMDVATGIVALGVTTGTIQFGAKAHAAGRRDEVRLLLSKAQGFRLLVAAPLLTVVVVLVAHVSTPMLLLALVFGVWMPGFLDGATTCLGIENKTAWGAKIGMLVNLIMQAGVAISVLITHQADVVWVTRLILGAVGVGLALLVIDPGYRSAVLRPSIPKGMPAGFWRFAIPTALAGVVATLVLSRTEVFFLAWLGDAAAVGYFALAFGLASHIFAPAQALVGPLMPAISGLREVDVDSVKDAFWRTIRTSSLMVAALCVVGVPAFALLIPVLYGDAFSVSAPMFVALSISAGLLIAAGPVSAFVMGRLAARAMLMINLVALAIDAGLAASLIPVIGAWGAVLANMSGAVTLLTLLVRAELRAMAISWRDLLGEVRSLVVALPICVLVWWAAGHLGLPAVVEAVIAGLVGTAAWVIVVRLVHGGVTESDARALERVVPPRGRALVARLLASVVTKRKT